ncbi:MAG TPA: TraR/DksA family transcriptional regulator [Verrucomicrobiae bacterium]|nr:TraR/DksA family transcriptional regulator [Verrucomicrobiae bacterium]
MATSADILGTRTRNSIPARWAQHYERLCLERDKILQRDGSAAESFQPKLDDLADAAALETDRSLSIVTSTATHGMMLEIVEAIRRIERGTYGVCEITGEPIATERLNSIPWARYSLEGQKQAEENGWSRRASLPSLEGLAGIDSDAAESDGEEEGD